METIEKQLADISSYACTDDGIENLFDNNLRTSVEVVNTCLKFDDQDLVEIFSTNEHRTALLMIAKLALHLFSNMKNLEVFQCDHLYNIGLLNIKIMHNNYIPVTDKEDFYDVFFRYRFKSENLTECLLQHIRDIQDSSLVQIVCLWLDIVVHYQHVVRKQKNDLDYSYFDPRKIISECIIQQKYDLHTDIRLRGSFLFYLTYIPYSNIHDDEKLASICRQYILSQMKDLNRWSSDTIHCVMGSVCLIAKNDCLHYFMDDEEYYQSLLIIAIHEKFQQRLVSTWTNDETILIHTITKCFYQHFNNNERMKVILSTAIDKLHKLYQNAKCKLTKMNLCYLILASSHEESNVSDEILLACFEYIGNSYTNMESYKIARERAKKLLEGLEKSCHYDSIKNSIIRLDKIDKLIDLIRTHGVVIYDILALLSTKSDAQRILQENRTFVNGMMSLVKNVRSRHSLQILLQNIDPRISSDKVQIITLMKYRKESEKPLMYQRDESTQLARKIQVRIEILISCHNTNLARRVENHLQKVGYNVLILNQCNDDREKEKNILTCKCMIVCLTDDYNQHQSELIIAYKNQVQIIPVVIEDEKEYHPSAPFLKFILEKYSSSLIRTNVNEFNEPDNSLMNEIDRLLSKQWRTLSCCLDLNDNFMNLRLQAIENISTTENLYKACKENDINTVRQYLQNINIEILNQYISNGSTALHIASYNGHNEIVQLLLNAGASRSIRNRPYGLTAYEEARTQSTKDLFRTKMDDDDQYRFINDDFYIEWMTVYRDPGKKRNYLRQKLHELLSYQNSNNDNTYQVIAERMHVYIDTLPLSNHVKQILKRYFSKMEETADPVYIIKAYTSATSFHKYLNEHIAQHGIDFFNRFIVDIHVDYSIVRCQMKIIAIVMQDRIFHEYRYCGKTYRGMLMTEEDLYKYIVNSKIMNKSFLSTSKVQEIAEAFSGCAQDNFLRKTPDQQSIHIAVLCAYIIKNSGTALDIETISERISDEKEVLILPFSVFEVKNVRRSSMNTVEIELEEVANELLENCDQTFFDDLEF